MLYSGAPHDSKTRKAHGVAICLNPIATKVWKESGSEWVPINERIIKIRLYCAPVHITVIAVYSPINPITKQMSDESDKFYNDLQDTLNDSWRRSAKTTSTRDKKQYRIIHSRYRKRKWNKTYRLL
ncbi:hypothetical protein I4U23_031534 [Adineta vaga]|nr:hypothetical protein I4U23_031534 [Adineta vaga]